VVTLFLALLDAVRRLLGRSRTRRLPEWAEIVRAKAGL
jgi:hypothetical protein